MRSLIGVQLEKHDYAHIDARYVQHAHGCVYEAPGASGNSMHHSSGSAATALKRHCLGIQEETKLESPWVCHCSASAHCCCQQGRRHMKLGITRELRNGFGPVSMVLCTCRRSISKRRYQAIARTCAGSNETNWAAAHSPIFHKANTYAIV